MRDLEFRYLLLALQALNSSQVLLRSEKDFKLLLASQLLLLLLLLSWLVATDGGAAALLLGSERWQS